MALLSLVGCQRLINLRNDLFDTDLHRVDSTDKLGSVHIAVTYVEAWDSVAPALAPNFQMTGETALTEVIPNTADVSNQLLTAFAAQFGLGLPQTTTTRTQTIASQTGQATTSQTNTVNQTQPGQAPAAPSQSAAGTLTAQGLPGEGVLSTPIGQDPMLQHTAALALFQEVTLLNRYLNAAALRTGYRPYLARLQVSLVPYDRRSPYDSYTDISFFPLVEPNDADSYFSKLKAKVATPTAKESEASRELRRSIRQPVVVPLLVTDNLEGAQTSNTTESVLQLGLTISAMIHNLQANASFQDLRDELRSITGTSLNSLQTVGRESDNTIRVRFGAVHSPIADDTYIMVPRTHDVTLLILVPVESPKAADAAKIGFYLTPIHVVSNTTFRDSHTGKTIIGYDPAAVRRNAQDIFTSYFPDAHIDIATLLAKLGKKNSDNGICPMIDEDFIDGHDDHAAERGLIYYLMDREANNNYTCFVWALHTLGLKLQDHQYLWIDVANLSFQSGEGEAMLQLPPYLTPQAPPQQEVILTDDGKTAATGTLSGGRGLVANRLEASLLVGDKSNKGKRIYARSLSVNSAGTSVQITLPSLAGLCPKQEHDAKAKKDGKSGSDAPSTSPQPCGELHLSQLQDPWLQFSPDNATDPVGLKGGIDENTYENVVRINTPSSTGDGSFAFSTALTTIATATDHLGTLRVFVGFATTQASAVQIKITGGEATSAAFADAKGPANMTVALSNGVVSLKKTADVGTPNPKAAGTSANPVAIDIALRNLVPGETLQLSASQIVTDGPKPEPVTKSISIRAVERKLIPYG